MVDTVEQMEKIQPKDIIVDAPSSDVRGVKPEVARKIYTLLKKGRRYFGSSGAFMTHQAFDDNFSNDENLKKDAALEMLNGERDTTSFLKRWTKDKPGSVIIDSVRVPDLPKDSRTAVDPESGLVGGYDVDHVVVIGSEIILLDTKRWKDKKTYGVDDEGNALMSNKSFPGAHSFMHDYIQNWLDYLDEDACITGIVCISQENINVIRNKNWYVTNYRLVEMPRLEEILNEKWKLIEDYDKHHINSTLVAQMVVRSIKPFDSYSRVFDMNSLRNFK